MSSGGMPAAQVEVVRRHAARERPDAGLRTSNDMKEGLGILLRIDLSDAGNLFVVAEPDIYPTVEGLVKWRGLPSQQARISPGPKTLRTRTH